MTTSNKPPARESLADFVRRRRTIDLNFSLKDVEIESGRHGEKIVSSYVWRIENGHNDNPSPRKLRSLARGLRMDESELFSIVRGQSLSGPDAREERLLSLFRTLPTDRQEDLLESAVTLSRRYAVKVEKISSVAKKRKRA